MAFAPFPFAVPPLAAATPFFNPFPGLFGLPIGAAAGGFPGLIGPGFATFPALGATLGAGFGFAVPNTTVATTPFPAFPFPFGFI